MKRPVAGSVLLLWLSVACGPFAADDPLTETAAKLGDIRSGTMELRVMASSRSGEATGFALTGRFSLPEGDALPEAELALEQIGTEEPEPVVFIATGDAAFIEVEGQAYELPAEQTPSLRGAAEPGEQGPFSGLDIGAWVSESNVSDGGMLDGVETEIVRGDLDVVAAANDLFEAARVFGSVDVPTIEDREAERLGRAVESATLEVITGKEDRLLRKLRIAIDFGASAPASLDPALADLLGVEFRLLLAIRHPNGHVDVRPPSDPLPYESLVDARSG
jgi:hypothetical protein